MRILLSVTVILPSLCFISPGKAGSCDVTAESSWLAVDLVQLHLRDNADLLCLVNLTSLVGALASSSAGKGLVVDSMLNTGVLFLVPLNVWDDFDLNASITEWYIEDEQCWLWLKPILGFEGNIHEMDVESYHQLKAELCLRDTESHIVKALSLIPEYFWWIHIHFDVHSVFHYKMDVAKILAGRIVTVHLWQQKSDPAVSNVRVSWMHAPSPGCTRSQLMATIRSGCPSQKVFKFIYPENQANSELVKLPVNYRPPSPLGSSLPTSPHVYNADPTQPLSNTHFKISQNAVFKQCQDKASRVECNCSEAMEQSQDIGVSDCIQKVYRHPYQQKFRLDFTISLGDGQGEVVSEPISLDEVNGRTSFKIRGLENGYVTPENKDSIRIEFEGPGLFHFQATVVTNSSFCNLTTYFTVFVDRTPLMKSSEYSIIVTSTVVFGAVITFTYLVHHFRVQRQVDH